MKSGHQKPKSKEEIRKQVAQHITAANKLMGEYNSKSSGVSQPIESQETGWEEDFPAKSKTINLLWERPLEHQRSELELLCDVLKKFQTYEGETLRILDEEIENDNTNPDQLQKCAKSKAELDFVKQTLGDIAICVSFANINSNFSETVV